MAEEMAFIKRETPYRNTEDLIRLKLLMNLEEFVKRDYPNEPAMEIMRYYMLDTDRLLPAFLGLPAYSGLNPATSLLHNVVDYDTNAKKFSDLLNEVLRDPELITEVSEFVDKEISKYSKSNLSEYHISQKITFIANKRSQNVLLRSRNLQQGVSSTVCSIKLCIFSTTSPSYLEPVILHYPSKINVSGFLNDLQCWTSTKTIPPPLPLNLDPEYKVPAHLEYGMAILNKRPKDRKGYTIDDGAWVWTMSECQTVNGKRSWARIGQGAILKAEDVLQMFQAMRRGLNGRKFNEWRALVIIHSQDQLAMHRWQHSDQHVKKEVEKRNVVWTLDDEAHLDRYFGRTHDQKDSMCKQQTATK